MLERDGAENLDGRYPMMGWAEERFGPAEQPFADDIVSLWLFEAGAPPVDAGEACAPG